jgi:hypothetical protein
MARRQFNDGQELVFADLNKMGATIEKELYDRVIYELLQKAEDAVFSDGFLVGYVSPTQVSVNAGVGFQTDATVTDPEPQKRLLYRPNPTTINLTPPDLSFDRIDLVVMKAARVDGATESRKYKDATTSVISNQNMVVTNDWEAEFLVVDGTPAASPVAPAVPSGYIEIASLLVSAVTGLSGAGAVTDLRTILPVGGAATINSLAFSLLTQSAALSIQQAFSETDGLLLDGKARQNDFVDRVTDPAVPAANNLRLYNKGGLLFTRDSLGVVTPVGSGAGGGGGGAQWLGDAFESTEYNQKVKEFAYSGSQKETIFIHVPQGYLSGRQIKMYLGHYSPSAANQFKMQMTSSLVRKSIDAISSTANQHVSNSGDITNTVADQYRELSFDITNSTGQINGFAVNAGDLIRVELERIAPGGTEDTADIRMVPATTEVKFG